jgi:hypothetical protein
LCLLSAAVELSLQSFRRKLSQARRFITPLLQRYQNLGLSKRRHERKLLLPILTLNRVAGVWGSAIATPPMDEEAVLGDSVHCTLPLGSCLLVSRGLVRHMKVPYLLGNELFPSSSLFSFDPMPCMKPYILRRMWRDPLFCRCLDRIHDLGWPRLSSLCNL